MVTFVILTRIRMYVCAPQHLVVPVFKQPPHYRQSMYLGAAEKPRDILAFFRGDLGLKREGCKYSR